MKTLKLKNLVTGKINYKKVNDEFPMEVGENLHTEWDNKGPVYSEYLSAKATKQPTNQKQQN